jgi:hypothetical protein
MKTLTTLITLFLFITTTKAQFPVDPESGLVVYTDVIELPGMSKEVIHEKAKFWIISTLKSGDNMVELDGSNSDKIVGTGGMVISELDAGKEREVHYSYATLNFKFIVFIKEGKLKYSVNNFHLTFGSAGSSKVHSNLSDLGECIKTTSIYFFNKKVREKFASKNTIYLDKILKSLIQDFTNSMEKKNEDDW